MADQLAEAVRHDLAEIEARGFVVIERLLGDDVLGEVRAALAPHLGGKHFGRNDFEGFRTERVYSLPALGKVFSDLVEHPRMLAVCDALLSPNYLLTAAQAINIHPGENPQSFHFDDGFYQARRPRPAISISTIWAVDPFTEENGGTQVIPGSHRWADDVPAEAVSAIDFEQTMAYGRGTAEPTSEVMRRRPDEPRAAAVRVETVAMPPGSVIVFLGTLWHRGGANQGSTSRLALSTQYCEPWARQQENFFLSVPREVARGLPTRVQELLGYSIHPPFMGHAAGLHPRRHLFDS
jgi:ectoine hydroxylase-related dioxygenase (phytanoyl-CoA dioxygenase family)